MPLHSAFQFHSAKGAPLLHPAFCTTGPITIVPLPYGLIRANLPLWLRNLSVRNATCRNGNAPATDTAGYAKVSMRSGCAKTGNTIAVPAVNPVTCRPNIRRGSEKIGWSGDRRDRVIGRSLASSTSPYFYQTSILFRIGGRAHRYSHHATA